MAASLPDAPVPATNAAGRQMASFPLGGIDAEGRWEFASGNQSVREVVWGLLATRPGERLGQPRFGVGLHAYLHLPNTETTRALIRENIALNIARHEPRIRVNDLIVEADAERSDRINIRVLYRLLGDGTLDSLDFALNLA
jgi:phage baseplate assembly protein W